MLKANLKKDKFWDYFKKSVVMSRIAKGSSF